MRRLFLIVYIRLPIVLVSDKIYINIIFHWHLFLTLFIAYLFIKQMLSASIKRNKSDLLDFGEVDLSLKGIRVINRVPPSMHFISQLYLDGNHLLSLSGIEQFLNLEILHFDYNYISLPEELEKVSNPFFMTEISFIGNPI